MSVGRVINIKKVKDPRCETCPQRYECFTEGGDIKVCPLARAETSYEVATDKDCIERFVTRVKGYRDYELNSPTMPSVIHEIIGQLTKLNPLSSSLVSIILRLELGQLKCQQSI